RATGDSRRRLTCSGGCRASSSLAPRPHARPEPRACPAVRATLSVVRAWPPPFDERFTLPLLPHERSPAGPDRAGRVDDRAHRVGASSAVQLSRRPAAEILD